MRYFYRKMPHSTTILNERFGLDYPRIRAGEKNNEMEKVRNAIAGKILERRIAESARKEFK